MKKDKTPDFNIASMRDEDSFFYIHDGPEVNRSLTEKHVRFHKYIKEQGCITRLFLYLKVILGWWVTFIPVYPILGIIAYFLDKSGYELVPTVIGAIIFLPLVVLASPLLFLGGIIYLITLPLMSIVSQDVVLGILGVIPCVIIWGIILKYRNEILRKMMRTSLPWKVRNF